MCTPHAHGIGHRDRRGRPPACIRLPTSILRRSSESLSLAPGSLALKPSFARGTGRSGRAAWAFGSDRVVNERQHSVHRDFTIARLAAGFRGLYDEFAVAVYAGAEATHECIEFCRRKVELCNREVQRDLCVYLVYVLAARAARAREGLACDGPNLLFECVTHFNSIPPNAAEWRGLTRYSTGTGFSSHISLAYSCIVRSLENLPTRAVFRIAIFAHRPASLYAASSFACAST